MYNVFVLTSEVAERRKGTGRMEDFFKDLTCGKFCGWLYLMGGRDETGMRWCGWRLYLTPILVLLYDIVSTYGITAIRGHTPPGILISSLISYLVTIYVCKNMNMNVPTAFSIEYMWHLLAENSTAMPKNQREGGPGGWGGGRDWKGEDL